MSKNLMRKLTAGAATVLALAVAGPTITTAATAADPDNNVIDEQGIPTLTAAEAAGAGYTPWDGWLTGSWCIGSKAGTCFVGIGNLGKNTRILRVDPDARRNQAGQGSTKGYLKTRQVAKINKAGPRTRGASRGDVSCVAWMVSEYMHQGPVSARALDHAGLDMATRSRLFGGKWGLKGALGKRAMKETGHFAAIRGRASTMLDQCQQRRGPYALTAAAKKKKVTIAGETPVRLSALVRSKATNYRPGNHHVQYRINGEQTKTIRTNKSGIARYKWIPKGGGKKEITVLTKVAPDTLLLRSSKDKSRTRVIVRRAAVERTKKLTVLVKERAKVRSVNCPDTVESGSKAKCTVTYSGFDASKPREVRTSIHGPFKSKKATSCDTKRYRSGKFKIRKDGKYGLPTPQKSLTLTKRGWYEWSVKVRGNKVNTPAERCGGAFRVQ